MSKDRLPSAAQARRLADLWATKEQQLSVMTRGPQFNPEPYNDPTTVALVKYGWFARTGETKSFTNGTEWDIYRLTDAGTDALESFFRHARYKRQEAAAA